MESANVKLESLSHDQGEVNKVCPNDQIVQSYKEETEESEHLSDEFLRKWTEAEDVKKFIKVDQGDKEDKRGELKFRNDATKKTHNDTEKEIISSGSQLKKAKNQENTRSVDWLVKKLCEKAEVSERFASLCMFRCPQCNEEFTALNNLRTHVALESKCHMKIKIANVSDFITKIVCHLCKICSEKVLCDTVFIKRHLYGKHQMGTKDYVTKFALDTSNRSLKGTYSDKIIGNFCLYQCQVCEKQFKTNMTFKLHNKMCRHKKKKAFLLKIVYHQCKLCNKTCFCEIDNIQRHLRNFHGTTLDEYCRDNSCILDGTTLSKNTKRVSASSDNAVEQLCKRSEAEISDNATTMCRFKCPECMKEIRGWYQLKRHYKDSLNYRCRKICSVNNVAEYISKVVIHVCRLCSAKTLCDYYFIIRHLKKEHNKMIFKEYVKKFNLDTSEEAYDGTYSETVIGNLCLYKCGTCDMECSQMSSLKKHMRFFSHKAGEILEKKVYHKCKICGKTILCNQVTIKSHLRLVHGITIQDYCQNNNCKIFESKETTFLQSLNLSKHIENLCVFSCSVCNTAFNTYGTLRRHISKEKHFILSFKLFQHLISGSSYKCEICGKLTLCDKSIIRKHMTTRHNIVPEAFSYTTSLTDYNQLRESFMTNIPLSFKDFDQEKYGGVSCREGIFWMC